MDKKPEKGTIGWFDAFEHPESYFDGQKNIACSPEGDWYSVVFVGLVGHENMSYSKWVYIPITPDLKESLLQDEVTLFEVYERTSLASIYCVLYPLVSGHGETVITTGPLMTGDVYDAFIKEK